MSDERSSDRPRFSITLNRATFAMVSLVATIGMALILRVTEFVKSFSVPTVHSSTDTSLQVAQEKMALIQRVESHVQTPQGTPVIESIEHIETLRKINPVFYDGLQEGDTVLRYSSTIIVYRAQDDRVIRIQKVQENE